MSSHHPLRVLFLCTGNSARSILGEYLLRAQDPDRYHTASAGAAPTGTVNPFALRVLREDYAIDAAEAWSKSIADLHGAPFDVVITVCDHARDACPVYPGGGMQLHWGLPDPAAVEGTEEERLAAFRETATALLERFPLLEGPVTAARAAAPAAG